MQRQETGSIRLGMTGIIASGVGAFGAGAPGTAGRHEVAVYVSLASLANAWVGSTVHLLRRVGWGEGWS